MKLVARLLLETGRPAEARDLLEPLLKPGDSDGPLPDQPPTDREAAWLMSRAALQLGTHDTADQMLALSGDFGKAQPPWSSPHRSSDPGSAGNVIARSIARSSERTVTRRRCASAQTSRMCRSRTSRSWTRRCPASLIRSNGRATARSRCCRRKIQRSIARSSITLSAQAGTASRCSAGMKRESNASCGSLILAWTEPGARPKGSPSPRNSRETTMAWRSDRKR